MKMTIKEFKEKLIQQPDTVVFEDTMKVIEANYIFKPTAFTNGAMDNEAGQNSGSCKLFAFAKLQGLTKEETLACFGQYFRDVRNNPEGNDHQNIRNFMKTGFEAITFESHPLSSKP